VYRYFHLEGHPPGLASFLARVHGDDVVAVRDGLDRISKAEEGATFTHEFRLLGNDAQARWARLRGRVERRGSSLRVVGVIVDVTEQHRLEEELRRAHRLESLGRLAGGVAHDFNNILGAMLGSVELLEEICPPQGREDLQTVRHGAERARDLTAQLLAFARKQPIVLEVVDLSQAIAKVDRLLRRLVGPTIRLDISVEPALQVRADASQLEQVLVNLVVNARDAMPNGGALNVRVRGDRRGAAEVVVLEVEDHGVGMDSSTLGRLFDPFFSTKEKGTGLGLASSYGIIQQHGGDISVDSAPGSGARFRVVLPRVREAPPRRAAEAKQAGASGCVLLVDDDNAVRATTVRLLKSLGYEAMSARSGDEAMEIARTHAGPIDIMLCDIAMPGRSGPEVARDVKAIRPEIRVLFVSGYPEGGEDTVAAAGFLQKPFTRVALAEKLAALRATAPD
jgi:signal transduction histidine kinase/CheY-like chemotaxis protein